MSNSKSFLFIVVYVGSFFSCGSSEEEVKPVENVFISVAGLDEFPEATYTLDVLDISDKVLLTQQAQNAKQLKLKLDDGTYKFRVQSERSNPVTFKDYLFSGISLATEVKAGQEVKLSIPIVEEVYSGWVYVPETPIYQKSGMSSFIIDNVIYIGLGMDQNTNTIKSWWKYSLENKSWETMDEFPGAGRAFASSFAIAGKGYICLGLNEIGNLSELWEYDPSVNQWKKMADFPGTARDEVMSMVIGDFAYLGTGISNGITAHKDFYRFDPGENTWTKMADYPGDAAYGVGGMVLGYSGHALGGVVNNSERTSLHYRYEPATDEWIQLADFTGEKRLEGISFLIDNEAYFGMGSIQNNSPGVDLWKYDANNDTWQQMSDFGGKARFAVIYGSNGTLGYYGLGDRNSDLYLYFPEVSK